MLRGTKATINYFQVDEIEINEAKTIFIPFILICNNDTITSTGVQN